MVYANQELVIVFTGDLIQFKHKQTDLVDKLSKIIERQENNFKLLSLMQWNSVRVTFSLPPTAARKLKELALSGDKRLKEIGVIKIQIKGSKEIFVQEQRVKDRKQYLLLSKKKDKIKSKMNLVSPITSNYFSLLDPTHDPSHKFELPHKNDGISDPFVDILAERENCKSSSQTPKKQIDACSNMFQSEYKPNDYDDRYENNGIMSTTPKHEPCTPRIDVNNNITLAPQSNCYPTNNEGTDTEFNFSALECLPAPKGEVRSVDLRDLDMFAVGSLVKMRGGKKCSGSNETSPALYNEKVDFSVADASRFNFYHGAYDETETESGDTHSGEFSVQHFLNQEEFKKEGVSHAKSSISNKRHVSCGQPLHSRFGIHTMPSKEKYCCNEQKARNLSNMCEPNAFHIQTKHSF